MDYVEMGDVWIHLVAIDVSVKLDTQAILPILNV